MTTSRLRYVGSAAVLALTASGAVALVTAAGPAVAVTPHDTPVASNAYRLSIAVATKSIHPGDSDTVSGVLTEAGVPAAGDTVYLRARPAGKRFGHRAGSAVTGTDGSVQFTVTPAANTHYRLLYRGSTITPPTATPTPTPVAVPTAAAVVARSKVATVHVLRPSSLSIRARQGQRRDVVMGQLRGDGHALAHRKVMLQERSAGTTAWTTVRTRRAGRNGVVAFRVAAPAAAEELQLVFAGGPNFSGCSSGVVTLGG